MVIDREDAFDDAVVVLFVFLKRQIGHQTHLVAVEREMCEIIDKVLRQRLFEDSQFIEITFKPTSTEEHPSADADEIDSRCGEQQLLVYKKCHVIMRAVDGEDEVMPSTVGALVIGDW